jgi:hypothetical protein
MTKSKQVAKVLTRLPANGLVSEVKEEDSTSDGEVISTGDGEVISVVVGAPEVEVIHTPSKGSGSLLIGDDLPKDEDELKDDLVDVVSPSLLSSATSSPGLSFSFLYVENNVVV